jgi:putative FmdB family regulatory protein
MPLYDYKCKECGLEFEEVRPITLMYVADCPDCGGWADKQFCSRPPADHTFQPFYHDDFTHEGPILVKSKAHYKELCKQYGVYAPHVFGQGWNISEV